MGRRKRNSRILTQANERWSGLKAIDPSLDLGNGLKAGDYETAITNLWTTIEDYNLSLSQLDEKQNRIDAAEESVRNLSERMLAGVASKYGKNSDEYEKAGGAARANASEPRAHPLHLKLKQHIREARFFRQVSPARLSFQKSGQALHESISAGW